jgi:hypothetical protein
MLDLVVLRTGDAVPVPEVTLALVIDHGFPPYASADINAGYEIKLRAGTNPGRRRLDTPWFGDEFFSTCGRRDDSYRVAILPSSHDPAS